MPRDSAGNYTLPAGNPVITGTTIASTWANTTFNDLALEITDSLDRSGKGSMLSVLKIADGTAGAPGIAFGAETGTGLYRAAAGTVGLSITGTEFVQWTSTQQKINAVDNTVPFLINDQSSVNGIAVVLASAGSTVGQFGFGSIIGGALTDFVICAPGGNLKLATGSNITALSINSSGQVLVSASSSGSYSFGVNGRAGTYASNISGNATSGQSYGLFINAGTTSTDVAFLIENQAQTALYLAVYGDGEFIIPEPAAGTNQTATLHQVGYLDAPQRIVSASGNLVFADRSKQIFLNANNVALNIPANSSVAFPIGTTILVCLGNATGCTLTITTDTLYLAGSGSTGTRTLASYAFVTLEKISATSWLVGGSGIS